MIQVLGIPFDANSSFLRGAALAPPRIRLMDKDGSANAFTENGLAVIEGKVYRDLGDLTFENTHPKNAFLKIRRNVAEQLNNEHKVFCFGGDHSVSYPIVDAFMDKFPDLHILHLDAHADLYENFDDNPYSHASPFARILEKAKIKTITQVGIRTFNTHQREQASRFRVNVIEMKNFDMGFINDLKGPLYISLDLDVLDPAFAPGVSHHEPGGLSTRQLISIIQQISVPIVGADIVEYNPIRDVNNMTAMVAYKLFKELIGKMV